MRLKHSLARIAALAALVLTTLSPVAADGVRDKAEGYGKPQHVHHRVYRPVYVHHYKVDPYAYQYSPRGYYPFYGSAYWQNSAYIKKRNRLHYNAWNVEPPRFKYYKSWGYPKHWHNREWHAKHHGYHHRWHW